MHLLYYPQVWQRFWMCVHSALWWTAILSKVYSHIILSIPRIGWGSTTTETMMKIKWHNTLQVNLCTQDNISLKGRKLWSSKKKKKYIQWILLWHSVHDSVQSILYVQTLHFQQQMKCLLARKESSILHSRSKKKHRNVQIHFLKQSLLCSFSLHRGKHSCYSVSVKLCVSVHTNFSILHSMFLKHFCSVWLLNSNEETHPNLTCRCSGRMGFQAREHPSNNTHWRLLCHLCVTRSWWSAL